jgi:acyl transferase domain-containing protein
MTQTLSGPTTARDLSPREPIAIIGMGCRFAGTPDIDAFWRVLCDGLETVREYPGGRFDYMDSVYAPDSPYCGRIATRRGGFLEDIDRFDAPFFGISPREAAYLDPQQRLLLEVAWQTVENAGLVREQIAGSRTGVFIGIWSSDYEECARRVSSDPDFYSTTGGGRYAASGRLAYFFDLRGPNLTIDTACSSSLVAVHLACQSLWVGESEMALAGGANAILRPEITLAYSAAAMLSPEGRCRFGDASADGYVRSEGAAMVALKPLSRAMADRDPIVALIRGSAMNNDGQSSGQLVAPSGPGHEDVLRAALRNAAVPPEWVDYVEAHGTGTRKGDPVEIEAIGHALASAGRTRPCLIGSVKTNIGHTEGAAGVAGLIKAALALKHRTIPASLHFRQPNPAVRWGEIPVEVAAATVPWPTGDHAPIAGVSALGITGTNAHVVLEAAQPAAQPAPPSDCSAHLLTLSAHGPEALRALARDWRDRLAAGEPFHSASLADLCYTASVRRTHHEFRLALATREHGELERQLTAWLDGEECAGVVCDRRGSAPRKVAFVFPGQGGQWAGMGTGLLREEPVFRRAMEVFDGAIRQYAGWSVIERLTAPAEVSSLDRIDTVQPVLFAFLCSLAALWRSWGVEPQAVIGHSMGEVAAAVIAGALSPEDGAAVICQRSSLMRRVSGRGLMALTALNMEEAADLAGRYSGRLSVAAHNGPSNTVISGDTDAVEEALAELEARQVFCRKVKVDVASHSSHMNPLAAELECAVRSIRPRRGGIPLYSTTTGEIEDGAGLDARHWARNLRQPVLFAPAVERLLADGFDTFIEIGPHPVLLPSLEETVRGRGEEALSISSLRRDADERAEMLAAVGSLYAAGYPVNFGRIYPRGQCVSLPGYPWQRDRCWLESSADNGPTQGAAASPAPRQSAADHIYELHWAPAPELLARNAPDSPGFWILLADAAGAGDRMADELAALGQSCARVYAGESYRVRTPIEYEVNPAAPEDLDRVFAECALQGGVPCRGVVHFWGLNAAPGDDPDLAGIQAAQRAGCFSAAQVLQALARWNPPQAPRLWFVTADAAGPGPHAGFAQSPLWGLGRVAAREHPELRCANVDVGSASAGELRSLAKLLRADPTEDRIALRGADCLVARYRRGAAPAADAPALAADATYLITGGTGGIGLVLARWMVARGARNIVLVARREPAGESLAAIERMREDGAVVRFLAADVAHSRQVATVVAAIHDCMPPLRGVCHLAVAAEGALLLEAREDHFQRVMAPKMAGAWNLHCATRGLPLDFFVLFSSVAAVISQPGQASYASANAFLDGLAGFRRAQSLPGISLQWGPWAGVGLAGREGPQRSVRAYEQQGIGVLPVATALDALGGAMVSQASGLLILPVAWDRFAAAQDGDVSSRAFLELMPASGPNGAARNAPGLRERLLDLPSARQRRGAIEAFLTEQLSRVIKMPASRIDTQKPLGAMGVDSLMGLELVRRLASATAIRLPATAIFNYPTIQALAAEVAHRMGIPLEDQPPAKAAGTASARLSAPVGDLASMSDEDAVRALLETAEGRR